MATWARLGMLKLKELKKQVKLKNGTKKVYRYLILNFKDMLNDLGWEPGDQVMIYILMDDPSQLLIVNKALKYRMALKKES